MNEEEVAEILTVLAKRDRSSFSFRLHIKTTFFQLIINLCRLKMQRAISVQKPLEFRLLSDSQNIIFKTYASNSKAEIQGKCRKLIQVTVHFRLFGAEND